MTKSAVHFADLRSTSRQDLLTKLDLLLDAAGLAAKVGAKSIAAIKIHFGERGNTAYVRPLYVRRVVENVRRAGSKPFLVDTNTLLRGEPRRDAEPLRDSHGERLRLGVRRRTVVIGGGLRGTRGTPVAVNLRHYRGGGDRPRARGR